MKERERDVYMRERCIGKRERDVYMREKNTSI